MNGVLCSERYKDKVLVTGLEDPYFGSRDAMSLNLWGRGPEQYRAGNSNAKKHKMSIRYLHKDRTSPLHPGIQGGSCDYTTAPRTD